MNYLSTSILKGLAVFLLMAGAMGCDVLEDVFEKEKEVVGAIEEVGTDFLVVDAITYSVTEQTTFDGISGLADLAVGTEIEIEYQENGETRTALEVELADGK